MLIVLVGSLGLLLVLLFTSHKINVQVVFVDPNLEAAIREKIEKPIGPIRKSDLMPVISLDVSGWDINSLEGIQALRKLTKLNLAENTIEDLRPLAKLNMLTSLDLSNNQISSLVDVHIDQIAHLRLRELKLRGNVIEDIAILKSFDQLEKLNLRENLISDLAPLEGMTSLTYLNIHSNPVEHNLNSLGSLTGLKTLIMRNVFIGEDYSFLENLTQLNRLNIRNTAIADLSVIAKLMDAGALQDQPNGGATAYVDLLQIEPDGGDGDPYQPLRRYWDNISIRYPLNLPHFPSLVHPPQFSHESGFYEDAFVLAITTDEPGASIFYTLDGSEPALTPQLEPLQNTIEYVQPIPINKLSLSDNSISHFKTHVGKQSPYKDLNNLFIGNVIRAIVVTPNSERSNVITHSYFIDDNIREKYTLPVISIAVNPKHFFDDEIGIYVPGNKYEDIHPEAPWWNPANYSQRGLKWERPIAFEMFSPYGDLLIKQNMGIRIHGGATRSFAQKSLRLLPGSNYDDQAFIQYDLFPALNYRFNETVVDTFTSLILRNSGNDWTGTMFKDALSHSLLEQSALDIQGYQPAIIFLNGEYWGIQNIRTRYDEHYYLTYHGVEPQDLVVLDNWVGQIYIGNPGDEESFTNLLTLIDPEFRANGYQTVDTLSNQSTYEEVVSNIDIENFINYQVAHIYLNNSDWPHNNVRFWKNKGKQRSEPKGISGYDTLDGKWRWMFMDTDHGFSEPSNNTLLYATIGSEYKFSTFLIRNLLTNDQFKTQFINAFADQLNTSFREEVVLNRINEFELVYLPEITGQINRWGNLGGSIESWQMKVGELRTFAKLRPIYLRQHIVDYFNLPGLAELKVQTNVQQGYVRVNSVELVEAAVGVDDPANWTGVYFQGVPVEIEAIPQEGYHFVRWEGLDPNKTDITSQIIRFDLDTDLSITAIFKQD